MITEKSFNTGEVVLNYAEGPAAGPSLLLLHGMPADRWQNFLPILPQLMLRWHIFALDNRGCGESGWTPGHYTLNNIVGDIESFIREVIGEPAVILGHSAGALFSLLVTPRIPELVKGIVFGDFSFDIIKVHETNNHPRVLEYWRKLRRLSGRPALEAWRLVNTPEYEGFGECVATLSKGDPEVFIYNVEGRLDELMETVDYETLLPSITCPVLIVQSDPEFSRVLPDSEVEYALSLLKEAYHVKIQGFGHELGLNKQDGTPLLNACHKFLEALI